MNPNQPLPRLARGRDDRWNVEVRTLMRYSSCHDEMVDQQGVTWQGKYGDEGTVLISRGDGDDLTAHHMEAVMHYLIKVVCPAIKGVDSLLRRVKAINNVFSSSPIDGFFEEFQHARLAKGDMSWAGDLPLRVLPKLEDHTGQRGPSLLVKLKICGKRKRSDCGAMTDASEV
jgi:hypothetical protein